MVARVVGRIPEAKGVPTIGELLAPFIHDRPLWDYRVESPMGFQDRAEITVKVVYATANGRPAKEMETFLIIGTCVKKIFPLPTA